MKVSIIIPVYNAEKYLENNIRSILDQTYSDIEIIYIDDGSTDHSIEILQEYAKKDNRIKIIRLKNGGVSRARNIGIKSAKGEYLCFIDSDDVVTKNFCEVLLNNIIGYDCELSVCGYQYLTDLSNKLLDDHGGDQTSEIGDEEKYVMLFDVFKGFLCNKMFKKSIIEENSIHLNENIFMCEDLLFNFEYFRNVHKIIYCNAKLYGYYVHYGNASKKISDEWYSILSTYKKLLNYRAQLDEKSKELLLYNYLSVIFETHVRCKIQNYDFEDQLKKYGLNPSEIKYLYWTLLKKSNLKFLYKLKLILFFNVFPISYPIKRSRLLKNP